MERFSDEWWEMKIREAKQKKRQKEKKTGATWSFNPNDPYIGNLITADRDYVRVCQEGMTKPPVSGAAWMEDEAREIALLRSHRHHAG